MSLRGSEQLRYASEFYCPKEPEVPHLLIYYPGTDGGNSQYNMYIISQSNVLLISQSNVLLISQYNFLLISQSNVLLIIDHNADISPEFYQYQSRR